MEQGDVETGVAYGACGLRLGQGACADDGAALGPGNLVLIEESLDGSSYLVRSVEENSVQRPMAQARFATLPRSALRSRSSPGGCWRGSTRRRRPDSRVDLGRRVQISRGAR
jgi:hypothetical protein